MADQDFRSDHGQFKRWQFVKFNDDDEPPKFMARSMDYLCFSQEICPDTGNIHWQGYVEYKVKKRKDWCYRQKTYEKASFKVVDADGATNRDYCYWLDDEHTEPNNTFAEYGTMQATQGARTDLVEIREKIMAGEIDYDNILLDYPPYLIDKHGRIIKEWCMARARTVQRREMPETSWFYGETETGKSHAVKQALTDMEGDYYENCYWHNAYDSKWWDGYKGQKHVILDDFRGYNMPLPQLLQILDKYPCSVPKRYAGASNTPMVAKYIWITCNASPELTYSGAKHESLKQLRRRLTHIKHFVKVGSGIEIRDAPPQLDELVSADAHLD